MSEKYYDELLSSILCNEGNIVNFFDKIFDFLNRRTDYFKIKNQKNSTEGLEMDEAEKIIKSVFCKYMEQAMAKYWSENISFIDEPPLLDYVAEEIVETTESENVIQDKSASIPSEEVTNGLNKSEINDQQSEVKVPWMDPDCYNGAKFDEYSWAQTIQDIDVRIQVPKYIINGKRVRVNIRPGHITAEAYLEESWTVLEEGDLQWNINVEESTWTLVPGEHIHICLQKIQDRWWDSLFKGEPKIDMKKIDPSMSYEDLDEESQAKISELLYNEHQKRLGKPTVEQSKIQSILKDAWNIEGSPFKGQPFDPTIVDIQNSDTL